MQPLLALTLLAYITEAKKRRLSDVDRYGNYEVRRRGPIDVYPAPFEPVDFGHVHREGIGDPNSDVKQPIDLLERDMKTPRNLQEAKEFLEKYPKSQIQYFKHEEPKGFSSPRDAYHYSKYNKQSTVDASADKYEEEAMAARSANKKIEYPLYYNLAEILQRNVQKPPAYTETRNKSRNLEQEPKEINSDVNQSEDNKYKYFSKGSFDLMGTMNKVINWTTCAEFGRGANFHPKDIIDIDWVPFYIWSTMPNFVANVHRFSEPTKKIVREYKEQFGPNLNKTIDWEQPKLLLKERKEMLLIAGDRKGLFYAVPKQDIPLSLQGKNFILPVLSMRMKINNPYLSLMFCEDEYATIMAMAGTEPLTYQEKESQAKIINFRGRGRPAQRNIEEEESIAKAIMENKRHENARKFLKAGDRPRGVDEATVF